MPRLTLVANSLATLSGVQDDQTAVRPRELDGVLGA
jgi:hypothetical protein